MDLEQLLALLGCANVAEAATLIARMNAFLGDAKASTGKSASADALDAMRTHAAFAKSVETALGATGPAALGRIEALKAANERVAELEAETTAARKAVDDRDAKELIDQATACGKIKPAAREKAERFYAKHGIDGLRSFVDSLPEGQAPNGQTLRQSAPHSSGALSSLSNEDRVLAKAMGIAPEELIQGAKHWEETGGVISEHHTIALNRKSSEARA